MSLEPESSRVLACPLWAPGMYTSRQRRICTNGRKSKVELSCPLPGFAAFANFKSTASTARDCYLAFLTCRNCRGRCQQEAGQLGLRRAQVPRLAPLCTDRPIPSGTTASLARWLPNAARCQDAPGNLSGTAQALARPIRLLDGGGQAFPSTQGLKRTNALPSCPAAQLHLAPPATPGPSKGWALAVDLALREAQRFEGNLPINDAVSGMASLKTRQRHVDSNEKLWLKHCGRGGGKLLSIADEK